MRYEELDGQELEDAFQRMVELMAEQREQTEIFKYLVDLRETEMRKSISELYAICKEATDG